MAGSLVAFDTRQYEKRDISSLIYEPVPGENGAPMDFRIVYASDVFAASWRATFGNDDYLGTLLRGGIFTDEYTLGMLERFTKEEPYAFVSYLPMVNMHLFLDPIPDLPEPYGGFFVTNLTNYASQDARDHFLRNVKLMGGNTALIRVHDDGSLEPAFVSEEFAQMMECDVAEAYELMSGLGFFKTTKPEDRPLVRSMLRNQVAYDGSSTLTIRKITAKRNEVWVHCHYAFFDDFDEHYIYCTYNDVSTLKGYEERLRSVYANLGNSFYQVDDKTLSIMRVNLTQDSIEEIRGRDTYESDSITYSYTESMRQRCVHFPISAEREQFLRTFDRTKLIAGSEEGKNAASQMLFSIRKDGTGCFVNISMALTRHPLNGDLIAFITEKECNSHKVKKTLTNRILAEQFDMVAYLTDGRYGVTIGEAARIKRGSIFPTSRNGEYRQYLDNQVLPVLHGDEDQVREMAEALALETVVEKLRTKDSYVVDIAIELDGQVYYKQFDFYSVDPEAEFYILLKSDTTEIQEKHLEMNEQLRTALEAANQANVAKTSFLSSMSHEIRTPMNAIIGLNSIALNDPDLPDKTREYLEKMRGSAQHLLSLINDVLDMSRIESGRMSIRSEEFSFAEMLGQINTMINGQCEDRDINYECHVVGALDDRYIGDAMKLKQVIINILGNAVKFTSAGGTVSFTVEKLAEFEDQTTLRFIMQDTGKGMDKDYLPKIFDAFSQEKEGEANKLGSTGLGMAITKNIVELMNGNIFVESEKGVGSTFTVDVTLRNCEQIDEHLGDIRLQDMHVLVVDDDPVACEHARIVLEQIGISADLAYGGAQAIEEVRLKFARGETYNLVLVDWKMPEIDGVEVTREIRKIVGDDSAVVVLTGYDWEDIEEEATDAGVDNFMAKPLFSTNVLSAFRQTMEKKLATASEKAPVDLTGRVVLVAEDVELNAEIMEVTLEMEGVSMEHAENGQIAVDMFAASEPGHYDAVLMDVRMPVLDGLGATKAIRELDHPDAKTVPIIAMTANAFDEDVQRSLQHGMNAHLAKPIDPDILFATLGDLIRD